MRYSKLLMPPIALTEKVTQERFDKIFPNAPKRKHQKGPVSQPASTPEAEKQETPGV